MSTFSSLGLKDRKFELTKELKELSTALKNATKKDEVANIKSAIRKKVIEEKNGYEARWNRADIYGDHEVKDYAYRMRSELMKWAKNVIDTKEIALEDLW